MAEERGIVELDASLIARAEAAGAPAGRSAGAVAEDAVRVLLGASVIDQVRAVNADVDPDEIAQLANDELHAFRAERQPARR